MNSNLPYVSIIILNWNGWRDTIECLESIYQMNYPNYQVIVVDNNSKDNSIKKIKDYCSGNLEIQSQYIRYKKKNKPIKIIEYSNQDTTNLKKDSISMDSNFHSNSNHRLYLIINDKNYYFVKGNNIGIKFALFTLRPDYILLLNNDTIVERDLFSEVADIIEKDSKIGIIGPRICSYYNPNKNQWNGLDNLKEYVSEVDFVSGAALLFRSDLIIKIGLLDERYIQFIEDKDFCYSARKVGYKVVYAQTKSKVLHKISISMQKIPGFQIYFKTRNIFIFKRKHLNNLHFIAFLLRFFMITFLLELKRYSNMKKSFLKGVKDGLLTILKHKMHF